MNSHLAPDFEVVKASTLQTVIRSFETSVRANTRNTLLASYQFAKGRNWDDTDVVEPTRQKYVLFLCPAGGNPPSPQA